MKDTNFFVNDQIKKVYVKVAFISSWNHFRGSCVYRCRKWSSICPL